MRSNCAFIAVNSLNPGPYVKLRKITNCLCSMKHGYKVSGNGPPMTGATVVVKYGPYCPHSNLGKLTLWWSFRELWAGI